jgi:hypothetical protein
MKSPRWRDALQGYSGPVHKRGLMSCAARGCIHQNSKYDRYYSKKLKL